MRKYRILFVCLFPYQQNWFLKELHLTQFSWWNHCLLIVFPLRSKEYGNAGTILVLAPSPNWFHFHWGWFCSIKTSLWNIASKIKHATKPILQSHFKQLAETLTGDRFLQSLYLSSWENHTQEGHHHLLWTLIWYMGLRSRTTWQLLKRGWSFSTCKRCLS